MHNMFVGIIYGSGRIGGVMVSVVDAPGRVKSKTIKLVLLLLR
jgi:hypothetical protein